MIYVLVPAHNEAPTVGLLLWKVRQLFTSFSREYQLIVVNDGSTDATEEILAPYTRALPLTLLTHRKRQGYARSLEALLREAVRRTDRPRRDMAVTLQADFSESPDEALELIKKLEGGADIVVADRRNRAGATRREKFARGMLPRLVNRSLGISGATDVVGTMRGYRLGAIERLVRDAGDRPFLGLDGWSADLELLARVARHARRIDSVVVSGERPVSARPSKLSPLSEAWRAFRAAGALKGLPMPAADLEREVAEPAAPAAPPERRVSGERREHETHRGRHQHGRDRRDGHDRRDRREGAERRERQQRQPRQHADHRPKVERPAANPQRAQRQSQPKQQQQPQQQRQQQQQKQRQQKQEQRPAASVPAAEPSTPPAAEEQLPATSYQPDQPEGAATSPDIVPIQEGQQAGERRRRRRRGRGRRGRGGRGRQEGQQSPETSTESSPAPVEAAAAEPPPPPDPTSAA